MASKKKGKANKLARMSEEEKMRYLQHRAAIEEEARRRKEQLISTFMKNKLHREEGFSRLNMAKINQQWRYTLRQLKSIEIRQDLEDLIKWFDYTSNKKNKLIQTLLDDMEEAESQYWRMVYSHNEFMDKLLNLHSQRLGHFFQQYNQERDELRLKAQADLDDLVTGYKADVENLKAILYQMKEACEEKISAKTSQHVSKVDEIRNNMLTELENFKNAREVQMEKLWLDLEKVLKDYWEQTEDRRRQYLILREADSENCKQIFENNRQINTLNETLNNLKDQIVKTKTGKNDRLLECKAKKENARQVLLSLKKRVKEENEDDREKLLFMNTTACETTEELQRILAKGEKILQVQSLCRKLETLNEKICPEGFDKSQLTEEEENEILKQAKEYEEPLENFDDIWKLNGFWKRYNRALLEKEALALHYKSLQNEHNQLKSVLKTYLSDVTVVRPESKVSHANGVQILRQRRRSFAESSRKSFSAITCIEATQSPSIRAIISAQMRKL